MGLAIAARSELNIAIGAVLILTGLVMSARRRAAGVLGALGAAAGSALLSLAIATVALASAARRPHRDVSRDALFVDAGVWVLARAVNYIDQDTVTDASGKTTTALCGTVEFSTPADDGVVSVSAERCNLSESVWELSQRSRGYGIEIVYLPRDVVSRHDDYYGRRWSASDYRYAAELSEDAVAQIKARSVPR